MPQSSHCRPIIVVMSPTKCLCLCPPCPTTKCLCLCPPWPTTKCLYMCPPYPTTSRSTHTSYQIITGDYQLINCHLRPYNVPGHSPLEQAIDKSIMWRRRFWMLLQSGKIHSSTKRWRKSRNKNPYRITQQ